MLDRCSCTVAEGNGPPFFLRTFDTPVAEDIEMRLCTGGVRESLEFILVELYVR
jgi:predicted choloylglycine hydrolase